MESSIHPVVSYDISQQSRNYAIHQIIGYKGKFGEPLFAESDIVKVQVIESPPISSSHPWYKLVTYISPPYQKVKLSLVSISLCFRYKIKLSLIIYAFL